MRATRTSLSIGLSFVCATLIVYGPLPALAQGDPFLGTWALNVAKSRYLAGRQPPREQTVVYEAAGQGVKVTAKGVDAAGQPTLTQYTASYDGRDYPVTGNRDWDAIALKRINSLTAQFTRKRAGKVVETGTNVVSRDGKTRTITTTGVNAQGQTINIIGIYDKQ